MEKVLLEEAVNIVVITNPPSTVLNMMYPITAGVLKMLGDVEIHNFLINDLSLHSRVS